MSVLITADLHFSDNPRDAYRFLITQTLINLINKYDVKHLLILGDLTEQKDNHGAWLTNNIVAEMVALASWCPITILRGNHDGVDPTLPFFGFLRIFSNISFVVNPSEKEIPGIGQCLFLPHSTNYKEDWGMINLKDTKYDYIFAHNTFKGASGQHRELDGIPTDIFNSYTNVIAGDVHVPHTIGPITYTGSPYLIDFGDDFRPRMLLIDSETLKRKSITVPGPQKRLVECSISKGKTIWPEQTLNAGDILKVRVAVTSEQYARWAAIKTEIQQWGHTHGYIIYAIQAVADKAVSRKVDTVQRSRLSDVEVLESYGSQRNLESRLLVRGKKLMEKVK